jgi:putative transposase
MIYTINAIEALNSAIRRSVRASGHIPSDEAAMKLIWLQLRETTKEWKVPTREWHATRAIVALTPSAGFETYQ